LLELFEFFFDVREGWSALDPGFVLVVEVGDDDLLFLLKGEVVLEEEINAGALEAALGFFFSPEWGVEGEPVLFIEGLLGFTALADAEEDEVPQEVGGKEGFASGIEAFEDDLRVVVFFEFDGDDLEVSLEDGAKEADAFFDGVWVFFGLKKVGDLEVEVEIAFYHSRARAGFAMVSLALEGVPLLDFFAGASVDHVDELRTVTMGGPEFVFFDRFLSHDAFVNEVAAAFLGESRVLVDVENVATGSEEELEGGEALLSVDDELRWDGVAIVALLSKYHGAEKVRVAWRGG
jgi:hypothetical protein